MKSKFTARMAVAMCVTALIGVLGSALITACADRSVAEEPERDYAAEYRQMSRLVMAEMTIGKMASIEDLDLDRAEGLGESLRAWLNKIKIGTRKGAWSYNTYLRAYIDMEKLGEGDVTVDRKTATLSLRLPEPEVEWAGRDIEFTEDHYRVTGLRSDIGPEERARLKEEMNAWLKREVEERPAFRREIIRTAKERAQSYFQTLAASEGLAAQISWK